MFDSARLAEHDKVTFDEVEARKTKAINFLRNVVGDDDRADEVEDESVEDYAALKGWVTKKQHSRGEHQWPMEMAETEA